MKAPAPRLSLCIPTCRRPSELAEALASVLALQLHPLELLIGDDSPVGDDRTASMVQQLQGRLPEGVTLIYQRHRPPLGQARNVDSLLRASRGRWVCLLHDDDRVVTSGFQQLLSILESTPSIQAGFGLQRLIMADGQHDPAGSDQLNIAYHRKRINAGLIQDPLLSAIRQQFPNDGWIASGDLARKIGYGEDKIDACDFAFGLRLASASENFWFLCEPCSDYRLSPVSVSRNSAGKSAYEAFAILCQLKLKGRAHRARICHLMRRIKTASIHAIHSGKILSIPCLLLKALLPRNPIELSSLSRAYWRQSDRERDG